MHKLRTAMFFHDYYFAIRTTIVNISRQKNTKLSRLTPWSGEFIQWSSLLPNVILHWQRWNLRMHAQGWYLGIHSCFVGWPVLVNILKKNICRKHYWLWLMHRYQMYYTTVKQMSRQEATPPFDWHICLIWLWTSMVIPAAGVINLGVVLHL